MASVDLRRITEREWEALRETRLAALSDAPDAFGSTHAREAAYGDDVWREWARDASAGSTETFVLAWDGEQPVGMVGAYVEEGRNHAHLIAMWVAPAVRGEGVGSQLVAETLHWAAAAELDSVRLDVESRNAAARRLYERLGFATTGRSRRYKGRPHLTAIELERPL